MAKPFQDCAVLFGDSLTERQEQTVNLHQCMSQAYSRKLDILNRGFGGYNSNGGRALWDDIFARKGEASTSQRIRLVTIWHGANDSCIPPKPQSNPLERYVDNMNFFMASLTSHDSLYAVADTPISIILIAPPPIVPTMKPDYNKAGAIRWLVPEHHRKFRDGVLQLGKEWKVKEQSEENRTGWKVEVLDFWKVLVDDAQGEEDALLARYYTDGVHFNSLGYEVLWRAMSELIRTKFKGRGLDFEDLDDLPLRAPFDVDWTKTEQLPSQLRLPDFR